MITLKPMRLVDARVDAIAMNEHDRRHRFGKLGPYFRPAALPPLLVSPLIANQFLATKAFAHRVAIAAGADTAGADQIDAVGIR